jgi:hypothetical protein
MLFILTSASVTVAGQEEWVRGVIYVMIHLLIRCGFVVAGLAEIRFIVKWLFTFFGIKSCRLRGKSVKMICYPGIDPKLIIIKNNSMLLV